VASFEDVGRDIPFGLRTWFILEPVTLAELMDEELAFPSGILLRQDEQGRLAWARQNLPGTSDPAADILTEHWARGRGVQIEHSDRFVVNDLTVELDYDPVEDKCRTKLQAIEPNSVQRYGARKQASKHRGMRSESIGPNVVSSAAPHRAFVVLAQVVFERFAWELPVIRGTLTRRGLCLQPGQAARITHPYLADPQDRTARGISARGAELVRVDKDDRGGTVDIEAISDRLARRRGGYAPAAMISAWDAGTGTATLFTHQFSRQLGERDANAFGIPDAVIVMQTNSAAPSFKRTTVATLTVNASASTSTMTFGDALGFVPTRGDVVLWGDWDNLIASQKTDGFAAVADGGYVDSALTIDAYVYSV
jgi:hypothetical protein